LGLLNSGDWRGPLISLVALFTADMNLLSRASTISELIVFCVLSYSSTTLYILSWLKGAGAGVLLDLNEPFLGDGDFENDLYPSLIPLLLYGAIALRASWILIERRRHAYSFVPDETLMRGLTSFTISSA
jgi:hypothetical protein